MISMADVAWNPDSRADIADTNWKTQARKVNIAERIRNSLFYPVSIAAGELKVPEDGVFHNRTRITLKSVLPGEIRYTLDGNPPHRNSTKYENPFELDRSVTLRAALFQNGIQVLHDSRKKFRQVKPALNLALGKPASSNRTSGPPFSIGRLTDGGTGVLDYYLGYPAEPKPLHVTIDLGKPVSINRITVYAYFNSRAYESYEVQVSEDGVKSERVAERLKKPEKSTPFVHHDFPARQVRYIKIISHGCKQNVFDSFSRLVEIQAFKIDRK